MSVNLATGIQEIQAEPAEAIRLRYRKRRNARRYILRVNAEGVACVTIPRGGSQVAAEQFVARHRPWLEAQLRKFAERKIAPSPLDQILFRGELLPLVLASGFAEFGDQRIPISPEIDPRKVIKESLWQMARIELPTRVAELAAQHGLLVQRVSVRDQRSRWGSCSARGVISLNWRLVQAPEFVRDYIIVHELMHLRELNHSQRFWKLVREAFPETIAAERWLKAESVLLRQL